MSSSAGSPSPSKFSSAEKRAVHNALERKRRDHIKDMFSQLKDSVPNMAGEKMSTKASRAQILKKACDYIQLMRRKNVLSAKDLEQLHHQLLRTRRQISKLESLRATNRYVDTLPVTAASPALTHPAPTRTISPSPNRPTLYHSHSNSDFGQPGLGHLPLQSEPTSMPVHGAASSFPLPGMSGDNLTFIPQLPPPAGSLERAFGTDRSGNAGDGDPFSAQSQVPAVRVEKAPQ